MERIFQLAVLLGYLLVAHFALRSRHQGMGRIVFAGINILAVSLLFQWTLAESPLRAIGRTTAYVGLVSVHYALLRWTKSSRISWVSILYPLVLLVVFKYSQYQHNT